MGRGLDGFLIPVYWHCVVLKAREGRSLTVSGGYCEGETPLPIPNRAVKPLSADGTWPARAWESRSPPVLLYDPASARHRRGRCVAYLWRSECQRTRWMVSRRGPRGVGTSTVSPAEWSSRARATGDSADSFPALRSASVTPTIDQV